MLPYVHRVEQALTGITLSPASTLREQEAATGVETAVPSPLFHNALHELRTYELRRSRGHYERVVSVGASGRWYFDWFESAVGPVQEHVGVEAFEPEPDDLPPYATWVATTADRFDGLADESTDIVFAGQTTEHLWADELSGFLVQARRVIRSGGQLILDSPNRLVTEHLQWSHGGHSVELSGAEISELVTLAGFEVVSLRGAWRCRFGDKVLQLEEQLDDGATLVRRIVEGPANPDDSFVWWLIARPHSEPDTAALVERCRELYDLHWPTRVCRGMWPGPGHHGPRAEPSQPIEVESLPFMLHPGRFRLTVSLVNGTTNDIDSAELAVWLPGRHNVHLRTLDEADVSSTTVSWEIDHGELMFALTMGLNISVANPIEVVMPLDITWLG